MKKSNRGNNDAMRSEYDFNSMKGGVRGKYYQAYRRGTNVVVLKPDVAEAFPTEEAVNEALRGILSTARAVRQTGGLPDHALRAVRGRQKAIVATASWCRTFPGSLSVSSCGPPLGAG